MGIIVRTETAGHVLLEMETNKKIFNFCRLKPRKEDASKM